jgi:NTE family protein
VSRVAVIGGGGVAGIAWATGLMAGLERRGIDLRRADAFIGTSAGSVVGTQLACGMSPRLLLDALLSPVDDSLERARPYSQAAADQSNRLLMDKVGGDLGAARRRIGAFALRSETVPLAMRRAIVAARLPQVLWPAVNLRVVAVDTASGEHRVFDRSSGVELVDAIAASCAVPGAWPPVPIGGRLYMDGGIRSLTNADMAQGAECVIVIAPLGWAEGNPVSGHLRAEADLLRATGARLSVIVPDEASARAIGDNVLDPERCAPSARAGLAQGLRSAASLVTVWTT